MASFYLKNESGNPVIVEDLGLHFPDGTSRELDKNEINGYLTDDLMTHLNSSTLILSTTDVGDNLGDLDPADAIAALNITSRYDRDNPHRVTFTQAANQDPNTDITAAEAETLTDGSDASLLHIHDNRYYTQTQLQTTGQSSVHWGNITDTPSFGSVHWRPPVKALAIDKGNTVAMNSFTAIEGHYWWNTDDDHLYRHDGTVWVDTGDPVEGDRFIWWDGIGHDDHIYQFDGTNWVSETVPVNNYAVIVDDYFGRAAQFIYDDTMTNPPNWIKLADVTWGDHNSLNGRSDINSHPGEAISYNPSKLPSGLVSINTQDAIDELDTDVGTVSTNLTTHIGDINNPHSTTFTQTVAADSLTDITAAETETLTDGSNADLLHEHAASNITYVNTLSGLTAADVQAAIDEIMSSGVSAPAIFVYIDKNRTDTYVEDGSPSHPFKTISAAISSLSGPATLYVSEGTYTENVTLPDNVSLWGIGMGKTTIDGNITTGTSALVTFKDFGTTGIITINATSAALNIYSTGTVVVSADLQAFNFTINSTAVALTVNGGVVNFNSSSITTSDASAIDQNAGELILNSIKVENNSTLSTTIVSDTSNIKILQSSVVNLGGGSSIDIDNGSTATNPNVLADVAYYGAATLGSAHVLIEGTLDLSGTVKIPSGSNRILRPGEQIAYNPAKKPSGLISINVQDAIDELETDVVANTTNISNHVSNISNPHSTTFTQAVTADSLTDITAAEAETLTDSSNADLLHQHAADNITFDDTNTSLGATNVQEAIEAIDNTLDNLIPRGTAFPITPVPTGGDLFYRTDLNLLFQYDSSRNEWLSVTQLTFDWGASTVDGRYLNIHGAVATQTGYLMPRNGTILTLTARAASGNQTKDLEIRRNNDSLTPLKQFALSGGSYSSITENIEFDAGDYIQAFATSIGQPARDTVVMVTISWRE